MEVLVLMTRRKELSGRFGPVIDRSDSATRPRSGLDATLACATVIGTGGGVRLPHFSVEALRAGQRDFSRIAF
jgi:hypothetical protein